MRSVIRLCVIVGSLLVVSAPAWAQATLAGVVRDASGAVLPGVTVEAASPVLIEKVRTAVSDGTGRYRIESVQPGAYTVTFTLPGFATVKREGVIVSGTGVVTADAELRVGGVQETITVTGETPLVDVQSTKREISLDNETIRSMPGPRSYSYLIGAVPGVLTNGANVPTGPTFLIFPVNGGRGVESRLTVDGLNISNPPGGNQPPNFTADMGNAQEVTMTSSGGLGEAETAGLTMNIVPKQGANSMSGLFFVSGYSEAMLADNFTAELRARGATQPTPVTRVYDVNGAVGGPVVTDKLWYYMSARIQGSRQNIINVFYNQNAGDPNAWTYVPDFSRPAFYDRTWENYTPRITWQITPRNKITGSWDEQPVCRKCTGTASFSGSPAAATSPEADGHGEFSPQRVQTARWTAPMTNRLLLEAGFGTTFYQWAGRELDPNPTRDLVRVVNIGQLMAPGVTSTATFRSQNWYNNLTRGSSWFGTASYVTGSHSMKFGYQGNHWQDDREINVNSQSLQYTFLNGSPLTLTQYANGYNVNARAMQLSLFVQDSWTVGRATVQGALRFDHPWSWFPEQVQPASRFFPGATFAKADGVTGYNDITPRLGLAYDLFGNGRTAVKVNVGKYLQGASVSNLAYGANPSLRIPGGGGGIFAPSVNRGWTDADRDFNPDCDLNNPLQNGECLQISDLRFGSNQLIGAAFDPGLLSGWGVRPSDWTYGASIQHEVFPRASVELAYIRRTFTQFFTGGTVQDNLLVAPSDLATFTFRQPSDPRLPDGGGATIGPLYNINPNVFGQSSLLIKSTKDVGDDTRVFNGVNLTVNVRGAGGFSFSGGTSTSKVVNDWCDIRAAVPENAGAGPNGYLLNPYCHVESPWQTTFRSLASYQVPRIDTQVSAAFRDTMNVGTDQIVSLAANYTLTPADQAAVAAQLGRPMTIPAAQTVNLLAQGQLYGPRVRALDLTAKKILRFGGQRLTVGADFYNVLNNNVTLAFTGTFVPGVPGWQSPTAYMNPRVVRLNAEYTF
jgi:hypothetical protein